MVTLLSHIVFSFLCVTKPTDREGKGACPWACLVGVFRKHARLCIRVEKKRLMAGIHHFMAIVKGVTFQNVSTFNSS